MCFRKQDRLKTARMLQRTSRLLRLASRPSCAAAPARRAYSDLSGLTEDQAELRSNVATFFQNEVAPLAEKTDKENAFPMHLWEKFGEMGLLGLTAPEEYGGLAKGYLDHTIVMEEVSLSWGVSREGPS